MKEMNARRLVFVAAMLVGLSVALTAYHVSAQQQNKIEYGAVYDCGDGKSKFKVLSCKGTGRFDRCEVFYINEYSPGGGFKDSISRGLVLDSINSGCRVKGSTATQTVESGQTERPSSAPTNATSGGAICSALDSDSNGKTPLERTFRGVIRRAWEKEAREGSDGAVTITFQRFTVGAPRAWRPSATDAYSQADPKKPIYPVRTILTTCTDYRTAITRRKMERLYDCFTHKSGGIQCTQVGRTAGLMEDEKQYIPKQ